MTKPRVVFADPDTDYIESLVVAFASDVGNDVDIHLITDEGYYRDYFAQAPALDVLVVAESWHELRIAVGVVQEYVLCETEPPEVTQVPGLKGLYKYSSPDAICQEIVRIGLRAHLGEMNRSCGPRLVTFCSPVGGSGVTSLAIATSNALHASGLSVLFVSLDELGSFTFLLGDEVEPLSYEGFRLLRQGDTDAYQALRQDAPHVPFPCLPPSRGAYTFGQAVSDLCLDYALLAKVAGDYDFVVIDSPGLMGESVMRCIAESDTVVMPVPPDDYSRFKLDVYKSVVDCSDSSKFITVANAVVEPFDELPLEFDELVEHVEGAGPSLTRSLSRCAGVQAIIKRIV